MQRDEEELPPNELDLSRMESPQPESEFEELADLPPGETVNAGEAEASETDASDATDLDDADGTAAIRAIEDSLASTEGESPAFAAIALPSPGVNDSSEVKAPEESAEPSVSLDAEWNAGAAAPALLPVKWSPFMQLMLGNTPPPRGMEEGDVEQPWSSVNPPTAAEMARHSPMLAIERKGGGGPAISVFVQVHLSDDAIRRVAELTVREEANKSQHQIEVVAKRVFDIETGLFRLEAERRQLWR